MKKSHIEQAPPPKKKMSWSSMFLFAGDMCLSMTTGLPMINSYDLYDLYDPDDQSVQKGGAKDKAAPSAAEVTRTGVNHQLDTIDALFLSTELLALSGMICALAFPPLAVPFFLAALCTLAAACLYASFTPAPVVEIHMALMNDTPPSARPQLKPLDDTSSIQNLEKKQGF